MAFTTDTRVGCAAFLGSVAPATNLFLSDYEPLFRVLALVAQIAVATVTVIYIWTKIKAVRKSKKDDENS